MVKKVTCDSPIAQHFVDEYWQNRLSVAEMADSIVSYLYKETKWRDHICTNCGHFDRLDPNYCPKCGAKAVR